MNILRQMSSNHWQPWSWLQSAVCLSQQNDLPAAATTEGRDNSVGSRPTEKPGLSPRCGSRQLSVQNLLQALYNPTCAIAFINIRAHVKNLKHWQPCHCLDTQKILHTLTGMGSVALATAVPYPSKVTWISHKGQGSTKKKKKNLQKNHYNLDRTSSLWKTEISHFLTL